jgi:hypothetical protein
VERAVSGGIRIARGLELDADYFGAGTFALLAKKGAGKSYASRVFAEEMWRVGVPFVLFDPMGVCWGLRASADGKSEGIPIPIFGGKHGDAPLERSGGKVMADLVIDEAVSMILDTSEFGSHAAEREFAYAFLDRLYFRNDQLVHLLIDEADLFAPQKPDSGVKPLLGVMDNVVRRGRNKGIGVTLMTQRPAVLNKDVLTQIDGLVAMRVIGLPDREAVDHWVKGHGEDLEKAATVRDTLAGLANGESWWWVPELGILKRVQIREARTFDSSPSRKRGAQRRAPKTIADVDLGAIEERLAATIERAEAGDPAKLRRRVAELERKLAAAEARQAEPDPQPVPVLDDAHVQRLEAVAETFLEASQGAERASAGLGVAMGHLETAAAAAQRASGDVAAVAHERTGGGRVAAIAEASRPDVDARRVVPSPPSTRRGAIATDASGDAPELKAGARKILDTLARHHPMRFTRAQVGTLTGFKTSGGTFQTYWGVLKRAGYINEDAGEVTVTDAGLQRAGVVPEAPASTEEMVAMWGARLKRGAREMLNILVERYPAPVDRDELAAALEMTASGGTFQTYLGTLRRNGLADVEGQAVTANNTLFLGGAHA